MSFQVRKLLRGDDVHKTTAFRVLSSKTFNQNETIVSYIDEFESNTTDLNPTVIAQLNRLQRNLKGLPPLIEEPQTTELSASVGSTEQNQEQEQGKETKKQGKKIVFE